MRTCRWRPGACCQVSWSEPGHTGPIAPAAPPPLVLPVLPEQRARCSVSNHPPQAPPPPGSPLMSTFPAMSMAVVRSHIWMLPLLWPLNR